MKTTTIRLGLMALAFLFCVSATLGQTLQQLPTPKEDSQILAISGGGSGPAPGTILVGAVPPNSSSKPVLVFIHGYQGSANTWLPDGGNDMYSRAYNDGYRTAFVSVYEDQTMWTNGQLFRDQLAAITNYYGVNRVVVVAHSKGGLDTDAAVVHYGAHVDVERVITLGSPHYGSPLADLAQSGWTSWLGAIFGQFNDATYVMQTGYMNYFRSVTDNHANRPKTAFRTLGGWDWDTFSTLGPSGSYLSSIGYSYFWGGGGNDGVVPYNLSRRPNSTELYYSGSSRTKYDHFELNQGPNVWTTIRGQLPSTLSREAVPTSETTADYVPTDKVGSRFLVVASQGGASEFTIDGGATRATVEIRTLTEGGMLKVMDAAQRPVAMEVTKETSETEGLLGRYVKQYTLEQPTAGKYNLDLDEPYLAIVTIEDGGTALLDTDLEGTRQVYMAGESMELMLTLEDANGNGILNADVIATARLTGTLEGTAANEAISFPITFEATDKAGVYRAVSPALPTTGVYNLSLDAYSGDFHRSITKSVGVIENKWANPISQTNAFDLQNFPNPFGAQTTIRFSLEESEEITLQIVDIMGREVRTFALGNYAAGMHTLVWDGTNSAGATVPTGTYLIRLQSATRSQTRRVQMVR